MKNLNYRNNVSVKSDIYRSTVGDILMSMYDLITAYNFIPVSRLKYSRNVL